MTNMASRPDLVVDTGALIAILAPEADGPACYARLADARYPVMSSAGKLELMMVLISRQPATAEPLFARLKASTGLGVMAVDEVLADLAVAAFARYGKGRHRAALNFGDCFSYALAKRLDAPLLYKGTAFSQTDLRSALAPESR